MTNNNLAIDKRHLYRPPFWKGHTVPEYRDQKIAVYICNHEPEMIMPVTALASHALYIFSTSDALTYNLTIGETNTAYWAESILIKNGLGHCFSDISSLKAIILLDENTFNSYYKPNHKTNDAKEIFPIHTLDISIKHYLKALVFESKTHRASSPVLVALTKLIFMRIADSCHSKKSQQSALRIHPFYRNAEEYIRQNLH